MHTGSGVASHPEAGAVIVVAVPYVEENERHAAAIELHKRAEVAERRRNVFLDDWNERNSNMGEQRKVHTVG
jgi:hypothetical protein